MLNEAELRKLGEEAFWCPRVPLEPEIRIYPLLGDLDEYSTITQYWQTNKFPKDGIPDIKTGFEFISEFQKDLITSLKEFLTDLTPTVITHLDLEAETTAVTDLETRLRDYDGDDEILRAFKELLKLKDLLQELSSELESFHNYNTKDPQTNEPRAKPIINTNIEIPYFPQIALKYIKAFQETAPDQSDPEVIQKLSNLAKQLQTEKPTNWEYLRNLTILLTKFLKIKEILNQSNQITRPLHNAVTNSQILFIATPHRNIPSFFDNPEEFTNFARFATQVYYLYYRTSIKPEDIHYLLPVMCATLLERYHPTENVEIYIQESNDPSQVPLLILKWKDQQTGEEKTHVLSTTF